MRLTLRARILAAFLVALVAFVGALGYGIVQVRGIGDELGRVQELWVPLSRKVTALRYRYPEIDLDELRKSPPRIRRGLADNNAVKFNFFSRQLSEVQREASNALLRDSEGETEERMRRVVEALGKVTDPASAGGGILQEFVVAVEVGEADRIEAARAAYLSSERRLQDSINEAGRAIDEGLRADAAAAQAKASSSLYALAALTAVVTAFGLAATAIVGRALAPIAGLIAGVKRISAGDFSRQVAVAGDGEVAMLAGEFNQMARSLKSRDESLRRLSAYNENVLESVRVGILVADAAGRVTVMNRAAEEIWSVSRGELIGQPLGALGAAAPFLDRIEQVRTGGPSVRIGATKISNDRMVEISAVPFLEGDSRGGVVLVAEDVSERARVEQALVRSERLAAIGRMSSQITHEVRNPLNSMSLNVEMLEEELDGTGGEARTLLGAIASEIERLTEITEGYLTFARLPKPALELEQINPILDGLLRFVKEEAEGAGVQVSSRLAEGLPEVMADENQLRAALLNIVRNSMEAMRGNGNGGKLDVSTRNHGEEVEVIFADDGPGIVPRDLARIFDPFYSTKPEGTGLGLPLTQQIIEEHGGTIACASEPGRGTTFTIRLPHA